MRRAGGEPWTSVRRDRLALGPDDEATCFEVNPSPGYAYHQANTGQPIAASLARYLDEG